MTVQFIHTSSGEELAVLPRAEYEALLDADDLGAARAEQAALAQGETIALPEAEAWRIVEGETPLKVYREHRGLTQAVLAERAGLSRLYVSQLERGARRPSLDAVERLARALGLRVDDLL